MALLSPPALEAAFTAKARLGEDIDGWYLSGSPDAALKGYFQAGDAAGVERVKERDDSLSGFEHEVRTASPDCKHHYSSTRPLSSDSFFTAPLPLPGARSRGASPLEHIQPTAMSADYLQFLVDLRLPLLPDAPIPNCSPSDLAIIRWRLARGWQPTQADLQALVAGGWTPSLERALLLLFSKLSEANPDAAPSSFFPAALQQKLLAIPFRLSFIEELNRLFTMQISSYSFQGDEAAVIERFNFLRQLGVPLSRRLLRSLKQVPIPLLPTILDDLGFGPDSPVRLSTF